MIYKCKESDRERILEYIAAEPEINLFFFGDIENFGVDNEGIVDIYANDIDGRWDFILLNYRRDSFIIYSKYPDFDAATAADFMNGTEMISAKGPIAEKLHEYFPKLKLEPTWMCSMSAADLPKLSKLDEGYSLKKLGEEDMKTLDDFLLKIEEFADSNHGEAEERIRRSIETLKKGGISLAVVNEEGEIVSTAHTTAANSRSAMIVAVATAPEVRGKGFASAVVTELCRENFELGKEFLCLFYDNPSAGRIYRRIGFREIDAYTLMRPDYD